MWQFTSYSVKSLEKKKFTNYESEKYQNIVPFKESESKVLLEWVIKVTGRALRENTVIAPWQKPCLTVNMEQRHSWERKIYPVVANIVLSSKVPYTSTQNNTHSV